MLLTWFAYSSYGNDNLYSPAVINIISRMILNYKLKENNLTMKNTHSGSQKASHDR